MFSKRTLHRSQFFYLQNELTKGRKTCTAQLIYELIAVT